MYDIKKQKITRANEADAPVIAALEKVCFSCPYSESSLAEMLASPLHPSFLLQNEEGETVGYLLGQAIPPEGDLLRVAVHPALRRQGGGRALIEAFLTHLRAQGCTVCFLDVREHNLAAQALYISYGFTEIDRRKSYYHLPTEDAIVMRTSLKQDN